VAFEPPERADIAPDRDIPLLLLLQRPAPTPPLGHGTNAYVCSMEVDNFESAAAEIIKRGGQVALEKFAVPGVCWQGYFIDPDGNTFGLFQPDPHAK
jgi:predicted enzyme related to lactoylglutathione lyase